MGWMEYPANETRNARIWQEIWRHERARSSHRERGTPTIPGGASVQAPMDGGRERGAFKADRDERLGKDSVWMGGPVRRRGQTMLPDCGQTDGSQSAAKAQKFEFVLRGHLRRNTPLTKRAPVKAGAKRSAFQP